MALVICEFTYDIESYISDTKRYTALWKKQHISLTLTKENAAAMQLKRNTFIFDAHSNGEGISKHPDDFALRFSGILSMSMSSNASFAFYVVKKNKRWKKNK